MVVDESDPGRRLVLATALTIMGLQATLLGGCDGSERTVRSPEGGAGGTSRDGGSGGVATGGAPSSGGGGATSATGGTAGTGTAADAGPPSLGLVDLTLGGLNQDLPVPSLDCTQIPTPDYGCISWTAEFDGLPLAHECPNDAFHLYFNTTEERRAECDLDIATDDAFHVGLGFGKVIIGPILSKPKAFDLRAPPQPDMNAAGFVSMNRLARGFESHGRDSLQIGDSYDYTFRLVGITAHPPAIGGTGVEEGILGVFAATATPKATCSACVLVRSRGTFNVRFD